eukprot:2547893-Rhodomonas_salina.3
MPLNCESGVSSTKAMVSGLSALVSALAVYRKLNICMPDTLSGPGVTGPYTSEPLTVIESLPTDPATRDVEFTSQSSAA